MSNRPVETARTENPPIFTVGDAIGAPIERADAMLPADLIHDDEIIILLLRPSPLFIVLGAAGSLIAIAIITLTLAWISRLPVPWITFTDREAFAFGGVLALLRITWQAMDWWCRIYVLTDRRLIRKMGVVRVAIFETPLRRIQHTSVFRRLRERVFGLGTLGFATAGSDTYEAFWVMIDKPYAVHKIVLQAIQRYGRNGRNH